MSNNRHPCIAPEPPSLLLTLPSPPPPPLSFPLPPPLFSPPLPSPPSSLLERREPAHWVRHHPNLNRSHSAHSHPPLLPSPPLPQPPPPLPPNGLAVALRRRSARAAHPSAGSRGDHGRAGSRCRTEASQRRGRTALSNVATNRRGELRVDAELAESSPRLAQAALDQAVEIERAAPLLAGTAVSFGRYLR